MSKLFPRVIRTIGFLLGLLVMVTFCSYAFMAPASKIESWHGFRQLQRNTLDVLVVGNSHAECALSPMQIWEKTGATTYILKSGGSNTRQKLACVETALQTQHPRIVAVELYSIAFETEADHEHNYVAYAHMPWSLSKISGVFDTAKSDQALQYLFPLIVHHSRWQKLNKTSVTQGLSNASDVPATGGARKLVEQPNITSLKAAPGEITEISDKKFLEEMDYLARIASISEAKGAKVLFFQSPVQNPEMYVFYNRIKDYFAEANPRVEFLNMSNYSSQMGLTDEDFRDEGHLYLWGMQKSTDWWISNIQIKWNLQSRKGTIAQKWWDSNAQLWEQGTQTVSSVTQEFANTSTRSEKK